MTVEHKLHYSQQLSLPREEVFRFFADAANVGQITPPELDFMILSPLPVEMRAGAEIRYRLRLFGVSFNWLSIISEWRPPDLFVDEQLEGPYQSWIHRHTFRDGVAGTTVMEDEVLYRLPAAPLGELAHPLVKAELERIFSYRQEKIRAILMHEATVNR